MNPHKQPGGASGGEPDDADVEAAEEEPFNPVRAVESFPSRGGRHRELLVRSQSLGVSRGRARFFADAHRACTVYTRFRRLRVEADPAAVSGRRARRARKELRKALPAVLFYLGSLPRDELTGKWGWDGATLLTMTWDVVKD